MRTGSIAPFAMDREVSFSINSSGRSDILQSGPKENVTLDEYRLYDGFIDNPLYDYQVFILSQPIRLGIQRVKVPSWELSVRPGSYSRLAGG